MISGSTFDAGKLREQLAEIEKQAADPALWSNPQKSQQVMRQKKRLENVLATETDLVRRGDDITAYFDLGREGENVEADLRREIDGLRNLVDRLETESLLSGENDGRNAIVTIHPGAGGTDRRTGPTCCCVCISAGLNAAASPLFFTTTSPVKKRDLSPRLSP